MVSAFSLLAGSCHTHEVCYRVGLEKVTQFGLTLAMRAQAYKWHLGSGLNTTYRLGLEHILQGGAKKISYSLKLLEAYKRGLTNGLQAQV